MITTKNLMKIYRTEDVETTALDSVNIRSMRRIVQL